MSERETLREILGIRNLTIRYGQADPAVEDFSLSLTPGRVLAIVGESGSGKTTVARAALGLLARGGRVTSGDIRFNGRSLVGLAESRWRALRGTEISMIFQDAGAVLNPIRTIGSQYVEYIRAHQAASAREARRTAQQMLELMCLADADSVMKSYPFQLSGGMRQRVGIAMAMTFRPKLLVADEPTSALDVTTQAEIVRQIMELRNRFGTSVILVTHHLAMAAYMADHVIVMKAGRIVDEGCRNYILRESRQPYTRELLEAVPLMGGGTRVG